MPVAHHPLKLARLKIRQRGVQQQHPVIHTVVAKNAQRLGAARGRHYLPPWKPQLLLKRFPKAQILADYKNFNGHPVF